MLLLGITGYGSMKVGSLFRDDEFCTHGFLFIIMMAFV